MRLKKNTQDSAADLPRHRDGTRHLRRVVRVVSVHAVYYFLETPVRKRGNRLWQCSGDCLLRVAATKSDFNCDTGVFPVVRRKGDKSVYRVEKRQRRKPFAFYDIARLPPRRIEAGVVVCLCLEIVWVVVVAVRDDERLGAV